MDLEFIDTRSKVEDSKFTAHFFVVSLDTKGGKRRFDHVPEFDSTIEDDVQNGHKTVFVDDTAKRVVLDDGAVKRKTFDWDQVKKRVVAKVPVFSPFRSVITGYAGFFGSTMSRIAEDDLDILTRYDEKDSQKVKGGEVFEYRVSRKAPVFVSILFADSVGGLPTTIKMLDKASESNPKTIGNSAIEWGRIGDVWVPKFLKSETVSWAGSSKIECSVKYTWTTSLHDKLWESSDDPEKNIRPQLLRDFIIENQARVK
jgi:hypothetical protein